MSTNETEIERYIARVMKSLEPIESFAKFFYLGLLALVLLFSIAVGVQACIANTGRSGFEVFLLAGGVSLIVVTAATAVGCLLGFLFGIPRSLQGNRTQPGDNRPSAQGSVEQPRDAASVARSFMNNTSLEEISDWLTKIIIGLGLVQFQLLIEYLYKCALYASSFVAAQPIPAADLAKLVYDPRVASPFFFSLIIASLIAGCLFAYLETRTRLMLLFIDAEVANKEYNRERQLAANASEVPVSVPQQQTSPTADQKGQPAAPIAVSPTADDVALLKVRLEDLKTTKEMTGWASAQARTGNFTEAERGLLKALQLDENDDFIRERIIEVRRLNKDVLGALKMGLVIADRTSDPKKKYDLLRSALYEALYIPPPDGFETALEISKKLLDLPEAQRSAMVHLWRACALGQKYKVLKEKNDSANQAEMKAIQDEALKLIAKVVELATGYEASERELMRSLYEGKFGEEDDLKVFKSPEFDAVIYRGKP